MLTQERPVLRVPASFDRIEESREYKRRIFDWEATYGIWLRDLKKFGREKTRLWGGWRGRFCG